MRRIAIAVMSTVSGLVLLFSYHTSLGPDSGSVTVGGSEPQGGGATAGAGSAGSGDASAATGSSGGSSTGTQAGDAGGSGTFTGPAVQTRWGPVQVQIVVQNGKIVKAVALEVPNGNHHDDEINSLAVPQLQDATVQANSAHIDAVSGATVTSDGYISSLQSAVDQAHL